MNDHEKALAALEALLDWAMDGHEPPIALVLMAQEALENAN